MQDDTYDLAEGPSLRTHRGDRPRWSGADLAPFSSASHPTVPYSRERVVALPDGEVIAGHVTLADAMTEAKLAHNPALFATAIAHWITINRKQNDQAEEYGRAYIAELSAFPAAKAAVDRARRWAGDRGETALFPGADLSPHVEQTIRLHLQGDSLRQIAVKMGITHHAVDKRLKAARDRILEHLRDADGA